MLSQFLRSSLVLFLLAPISASAVSISEIEFDVSGSDTGREWVEVYNESAVPIDLAGWKLLENGTHHKIISLTGAIPAGGYGVIVTSPEKFKIDWPQYSGPLFDSTFSLSNSGETLVLKNASSTEQAKATYTSKKSEGNTLNFISGAWQFRRPSPGLSPAATISAPLIAQKEGAGGGNVSVVSRVQEVKHNEPRQNIASPERTLGTEARGFGIIPWLAGLLAIVVIGVGAIFLTESRSSSGYTIIEDNS